MRKRSTVTLLIALFVPVSAVGCRQILGLDDPMVGDGGGGNGDASPDGAVSSSDGSTSSDGMTSGSEGGPMQDGSSGMDGTTGTMNEAGSGFDAGLGFAQIAGETNACAVMGDGRVACWGPNPLDEQGIPDAGAAVFAPRYLPGITNAKQIASGGHANCALLTNGTAKCWGQNSYGACAPNIAEGTCPTPTLMQTLDGGTMTGLAKLAGDSTGVGASVFGAITTGTNALCWGSPQGGPCSAGTSVMTPTAMYSPPGTDVFSSVVDMSVGSGMACLVLADGTVRCSGGPPRADGISGSIYYADFVTTDGTTKYMGAESVSCGYQHCCAIQKTDHSVVSCWGDNSGGELGNAGGGQYANTAVQGLGGKVAQIAAGYTNTCALLEDGTVQCWGGNAHGEVGNGNTNPISTPTTVTFAGLAAGVKARTVMTMGFFSCATMTDATAWCWGKGDEGELGDGMGLASFVPVQVKMPQ